MSGILADTSVWVAYLRHGPDHPLGERLDAALDRGDLRTCGPVVAELLVGTRETDRAAVAGALRALHWIELGRDEWIAAGELARSLRAAGRTVPLTDVEIAVAAIAGQATLLSTGTDFGRIAAVEPRLEVELVTS